ncbi:toll/interleukin-1 receptor domain-containing protein [Salmonella enterica subsp. enterica]|uniref:Toll/interleukin-1 receptor domain-containing protein n=1 Tax=Salmonella enterica I TaxID=59201 RepID=A0A5Y3I1G3_SALET|nr:toll/interleukin-1 receptor domain-containing protein [Salmonella enterica]EBV4331747.1 toll/interleukin-1 receptor domain-containing protein [Salmonella enterica subsp. enterica serovar Caracas]ECE0044688.1 toll/interleukin-1 receptor domain-containing protein [Salmonella enterica subsp. enterica]ECT8339081.1 toll/interleukin-1 receptor domain-containing protein [Salmonella enterica subsp. enterica serovar Anatum]EEJ9482592.1 toll/interleukin-1 receptor domain-containing protein [Salmonella
MTTLVFSYTHADEALRNELEKHLSPLKRMGKITTWHDRCIIPGQEFENQIDLYFSQADIILLLISSDFIASDYCYQVEMTNALERHNRGEAVVIPVILRECAWKMLPFGRILAATIDGKPIDKFASHDEGYVQVVDAVSRAIANLEAKNPQQSAYVSSPAPVNPILQATDTVFTPRSSNLSLPKRFTDLDKDRACRDGFEYVARYFEGSLAELKKRHAGSGLEVDFHKRDADAFTCAIYMGGSKVGQCAIWRASGRNMGMGDIVYSQDGTIGNSYNESLTIDDNGQILGFRPLMGVFGVGSSREALLTNEGMAEHLWDMFFEPIKQRAR